MLTANDYIGLWSGCVLTEDTNKIKELDYICKTILANKPFYVTVAFTSRIPWPLVAAIHFRESDLNFKCHLHNGDPLTSRTVRVPVGRPIQGSPPFTWVASAIDALTEVWKPPVWDIAGCLEFLERYNGCGYQKHSVNTPYVWDYTNQYTSGLYVTDGSFDPSARESRPGAASLLKSLSEKGVSLDFSAFASPKSLLH